MTDPSESVFKLIDLLSADRAISGEDLGHALGVSRAAVWKHIKSLQSLGIEIEAVAGQGYRMTTPLELLDAKRIKDGLTTTVAIQLSTIEILTTADSTNGYVWRLPDDQQHGRAVFAECQTAGRGRRGRHWHSPFARNLYFSLGWRFDTSVAELACLSLVVPVAVCRTLQRLGLSGYQIKWPNDILIDNEKLAGCLIELQGDMAGPCTAVIGVGLNIHMPEAEPSIDQPWTDLDRHFSKPVSRNHVATLLLQTMVESLQEYGENGFSQFKKEWDQHDYLLDQQVTVHSGEQAIAGQVLGITDSGGLLVKTQTGVQEFHSGEVSVRRG